jgi:hypothetical protein
MPAEMKTSHSSSMLQEQSVSIPARISSWSAGVFLFILFWLHFIQSETDPSWNFISEYQVGPMGWLMSAAFFMLSTSCLFLMIALWKYLKSIGGIIGLFLLLMSATGMMIAAFNPTDPINTPLDKVTFQGELHQMGAMLDQIPFAAILISIVLIRKHAFWKANKSSLIAVTLLVSAGLILFIVSLSMYMPADRIFGPHVPVGWQNRFMIVSQGVWIMVMAYLTNKANAQQKILKSGF